MPTEHGRDGDWPTNQHDDGQPPRQKRFALVAALNPIVTMNAKGVIQSASESVEPVLGWKPAELLGLNVKILIPESRPGPHNETFEGYQQADHASILNRPRRFVAIHKNGSVVPIELCVSRAELPAGAAPLFVGVIRDISAYAAAERDREEAQVRSQQQLAEQASALQQATLRLRMTDRMASIGTLAAGLGHDMNNVLLPVRARLNALKAAGDAGKLSPLDRAHVDEIRKSVAYLQQLADGLHFLAMNPETEENARGGGASTDLHAWWAKAGALVTKAVPGHVRMSTDFPKRMPAVAIAAHGLTQAVLNLVVNAGEAIPARAAMRGRYGHVRLWAQERQDERGRWIWIGVTDNGTGMTEDVRRRAMEMFFTTKPRGLGTGLGLSLVRTVADRAGGRVEIESEPGRGTTVALVVPSERAADRYSEPEAPGAAVSLRDNRAGVLIRHVLQVSGAPVRADNDPLHADIWVTEPTSSNLAAAQAWRKSRPRGRLVLFGAPGPRSFARWKALRPVIIKEPEDFEAIRSALAEVISPND